MQNPESCSKANDFTNLTWHLKDIAFQKKINERSLQRLDNGLFNLFFDENNFDEEEICVTVL
jgi:hypothetical protein